MKRSFGWSFLIFLFGCISASTSTATLAPTAVPLAALPEGCTSSSEIIRAELAKPARGYPYSYRVYLPPCFSLESKARYPVLYLVPGRSSSPDSWLNAGLPAEVDRLILAQEIPPLIMVTTEDTDFDPLAETIYEELIPFVESQYPIAADRRYRAVAGGSLGGIAAYRLAFQYPATFSSAGLFGAGAISGEEPRIRAWLAQMNDSNRTRVFMNSGEDDPYMLERARVMKSILDEAGVENQLYVDEGGHHYSYWVPNFEIYLKWLTKGW
jgi:enterochelin esterase family protein